MIQLLPSFSLDRRFAVQDLPDELQLPLLSNMVVPRIVSSSMTPTIQAGDRLELSPPTSLTVGSIVVFRNGSLLVCHRITSIDPRGTLLTRGDATESSCEIVEPSSVIGIVTGVLREGTYISFGQGLPAVSASEQQNSLKTQAWAVVVQSGTRTIHALARLSIFQHLLALLLRWVATVDVLAPAPLRSLPSHSKIASLTFPISPHMADLLAASNRQKQANYVVRLGPWRVAQYDPATASLLLRQSLREAGLEPLILTMLR
jgi:hypothetical protein